MAHGTVGSLFSGIGGLDLGLERAGWHVRWQVENNPYCQKVLAKHWPQVKRYSDIREVSGHELEPVDLICGGFPCQPVSLAGKRLGQSDARWLWPEFARLLGVLRPRVALIENVPGLLVRGFTDVLRDLASLRYDAEWQSIPAAAVGAPHLRRRVFIVAYPQCFGWRQYRNPSASRNAEEAPLVCTDVADAVQPRLAQRVLFKDGYGIEGQPSTREESRVDHTLADANQPSRRSAGRSSQALFRPEALEQLRRCGCGCGGQHWRSDPAEDPESGVGRVAHGIPCRVDRLRGLGNAVVPQVAEWIGARLMEVLRDE